MNGMSSNVGVIVPVFNKDYAINRTLKSFQVQSASELEILLIDDGSIDNSSEICDEICLNEVNYIVVHKSNKGVSSARNDGIILSSSKYLFFCDADDELPLNAICNLVSTAEVQGADIVLGGFALRNIRTGNIGFPYGNKREFKRIDSTKKISEIWKENNMLSSCVKLYRSDLIKINNINFNPNLIVLEDFHFVLQVLRASSIIVSIPEFVYYQLLGFGIESYRAKKDYLDDLEKVYHVFLDFLDEKKIMQNEILLKDITLVVAEGLKRVADDIPMSKQNYIDKKKRINTILNYACVKDRLNHFSLDNHTQSLISRYGFYEWLLGRANSSEKIDSDYKMIKNTRGIVFAGVWWIKKQYDLRIRAIFY